MNVSVTVTDFDMTSVLSEGPDDGQRYTLGDAVAEVAVRKLADGSQWASLRDRVCSIRDEEIRAHVAPLVADAIMAGVQPTNAFGEPSGPPKTLRDLILEQVKRQLTAPADTSSYGRDRETWVRQLVREQVEKVLRTELSEAIADEKAKVVAAVRAKAAELIARAVAEGVGR